MMGGKDDPEILIPKQWDHGALQIVSVSCMHQILCVLLSNNVYAYVLHSTVKA